MTGPVKRAPRLRWSEDELEILRTHFPVAGEAACLALLPNRGRMALRQQAGKLGLKDPTARPQQLRQTLSDEQVARALDLRSQGWSYARIGREFGVCEATATNAILRAQCVAAGFTPAKRDSTGAIVIRDVKRMRAMMMAGMKSCEIQLQLGVSASSVSHHRRKYAAELTAQRKGKTLPPPGGGVTYSGRKITREMRREVERLLLDGLGAYKISERTGVSKTHIQRARARLVKRLRRRGECLPGCDIAGRRHRQKESARFIPPASIAELRRRLLDREPVRRAAAAVGIGTCSAYRLRDQLAAELAAEGKELPKPILPGGGRGAMGAAKRAQWLPKEKIYRYRALLAEHGPEEAKRLVLAEIAAERRAEAKRPLTFEEQLARVAAGAPLYERVPIRRVAPDITLGGVATGQLG